MKSQIIHLRTADASSMDAYVAEPEGSGPFPGLILFQEAFGVNRHIRNIADRLASEGYFTVAPELFHRTAPAGFEGNYADFGSVMPHMQGLTMEGLIEDIKLAYAWLLQQPVSKEKIGSIGFCMGGRVAVLSNAVLPLAASVSYYGGNLPSLVDRLKDLHGTQLLFWGGLDKHILPEHIETVVKALKEAGKAYVSAVFSYADHAFNCDERPNYHPKAAREAWGMTLAFLQNNLK